MRNVEIIGVIAILIALSSVYPFATYTQDSEVSYSCTAGDFEVSCARAVDENTDTDLTAKHAYTSSLYETMAIQTGITEYNWTSKSGIYGAGASYIDVYCKKADATYLKFIEVRGSTANYMAAVPAACVNSDIQIQTIINHANDASWSAYFEGKLTWNVDECDSSHLSLCLNESACITAGGYYYNSVCNANAQTSTTTTTASSVVATQQAATTQNNPISSSLTSIITNISNLITGLFKSIFGGIL